MKSSDVSADILYFLSDGKLHNYTEIAKYAECSYSTARRHVNSLAFKNTNIDIFKGGSDKGGVRMKLEQKVSVEKLNTDDLQLIIEMLSLLQNDNPRIKKFVHNLSTLKEYKEMDDESFNQERKWALWYFILW